MARTSDDADLALEVKDASVRSVVFRSSDQFFPGDPDFAWMQSVVEKALSPRPAAGAGKDDPGKAVRTKDACGYHPVS